MENLEEKDVQIRKQLYTRIFCQCFSPCGKYLAAGDSLGHISLFSLDAALSPTCTDENLRPLYKFKAHDKAIYCLTTTNELLLSGGTVVIHAWKWSDLINKAAKSVWSINIPQQNNFANVEVNALALGKLENCADVLYGGCGDNCIHCWDLDTGKLTLSLKEHTDYIHDVTVRSRPSELISASEDGTAKIWDTRTAERAVHTVDPSSKTECARPELGKWLGCVAVDSADDWMLCGGGPRLSLWHLRSLTSTTVYDTPSTTAHFVTFYQDTVISGGNQPCVNHWPLSGEARTQVPCTPTCVYSICINENTDNLKVLSVAGSSSKLDICTNFGYRAFSFNVY